jgi:hypothetical protein
MRKLFAPGVLLIMLLASALPADATSIIVLECRPFLAPPEIRNRVYDGPDTMKFELFTDPTLASDADLPFLRGWWDNHAECRTARLSRFGITASVVDLGKALNAHSDKVFSDLVARKISYGEANQQWMDDHLEFERAYQKAVAQRRSGTSDGTR